MSGPRANHPNSASLTRALGIWSATSVVMGSMIGQAVFLVSGDMAREVGSSKTVLLLWILGGAIVLCGALCYAELGAAMPEAGGDYVYLSRGIHPVCGFLYGWTTTLIMLPGTQAAGAMGLWRLAGFLKPSISMPVFARQIAIPFLSQNYTFTLTTAQLLAALSILVVTFLNYFSVRTSGGLQVFLTSLKIAALAAIILSGFFLGSTKGVHSALGSSPTRTPISTLLTALVSAMFAYNGFQHLGKLGGEILNPGKYLPRAVIFGTPLVVGFYVLVNWVYFRVLGYAAVAQSQHVASDAVSILVGARGAKWLTAALMISAFGTGHSGFLIGPRVPFAMARDGHFFAFAKRIQPRFHSPSGALLLQGSIAILLVLSGSYQELFSYAMFATWAFFGLTAVAFIQLRCKNASLSRPFRAWGYPWTPLIFGVAALAISVNLWWVQPVRSSAGLGIIALGLPFFYYWRRRATGTRSNQYLDYRLPVPNAARPT